MIQSRRRRQFDDVRKDYSKSPMTASKFSIHTHQRQKSEISRASRTASQISHHSRWLCVGCYNKKLCTDKKRKQHQEDRKIKTQERHNLSLLDESHLRMAEFNYKNEVDKVNQFNLRKMNQNSQKKKRLLLQHEKQIKDAKIQQKDRVKQLQQKQKQQFLRKQQFRRDLQKQIVENRQRKRIYTEQRKANPIQPILNYEAQKNKDRLQMQNQYRNSLLSQIRQNQKRKTQMIQQEKYKNQQMSKGNQFKAITFAMDRQKLAKEQSEKQKAMAMQEILIRQNVLKKKKQREAEQRDKLQNYRKVQAQQIKKQQYEKQLERRRHIDNYLSDLKKQMEINRRKRQKQIQMLHKPVNQTFQFVHAKPQQKSCTDCHHAFPKDFLTKL